MCVASFPDLVSEGREDLKRRLVFNFQEVILKYTVGSKQKLGLGVSSVNDKIRVSKVLRGSVADDLLHEGDIIDEIDGVRPTSKEHTRNLLVGALKVLDLLSLIQ